MEEYIALKKEMRTQTSDTTVAGLTEEVMRLEKELRKADEELVAFQSTNSVVLSQDQGNSAANYLAALNQRLAAQKSEYELLQMLTVDQNLDRQQGAGRGVARWPMASTDRLRGRPAASETDADYFKAKQQLLLLQAEQQELGRYLRTNHPKMVAMSEEIARREQLLKIFRMQSAEQLESRKASLALEIQNLEKDVKEWDGKMLDDPGESGGIPAAQGECAANPGALRPVAGDHANAGCEQGNQPGERHDHGAGVAGVPGPVGAVEDGWRSAAWSDWGWGCCCCCSLTGWMIGMISFTELQGGVR